MCGFVGFFSLHSLADSPLHLLQAMGRAIVHRGPDDTGIWFDAAAGIGLAHQRLAIVDLSVAGYQPMPSACGRYVIAFNGEIYNYLALRDLLKNEQKHWRGHSDTETLLACLVAWGVEKTLPLLQGMFAFGLWDKQTRTLTLARDRMGEKPLYYGWQGDTFLFGSELKAFKTHPDFRAEVNRDALVLLLRHNCVPAPFSIYQGIEKLRPGHYMNIVLNDELTQTAQPQPYWTMNQAVAQGMANPFNGSDSQAIDLLEGQLSQSISAQILADVPLGAFLSGGVDSSTIVALMQRQSSQPVRTFAIGFNEPGYNEAQYAKEVANHLGTDHTEFYVSSADALAVIPQLPQIYCEPFADSSQIPTFLVSKMAREYVTVALSGDAGDELFGGYNQYQFAPKIWGFLRKLPQPLRALAANVLVGLPMPDKLRKLMDVLPVASHEEFYRILMSHWKQPETLVIGTSEPLAQMCSFQAMPKISDYAHWMMAMDAQTYMPDDILVKVDRAAMANSLETRVPMLDHRLVELACRLPMHMKIRDGKGKWVLREVLYRHVPKALIDRPKKGFSIPMASWLRGPLRDWAEALLDESRLHQEGYFHPEPIRSVWKQHLQERADHSTKLWGVLMFQAWLQEQ
ncbi:MAG: asparagine synthase (glutamine-hydrolyzing) [Pseudomonadales bacterium]|nr:asparagine synthase (glutamine-hydrolyzing) [Pseudomonadales bacterium]